MSERPRLTPALASTSAVAAHAGVLAPPASLLTLPERAVQFGTGAFLRGFVDFFIDEANRRGTFGGRVVAVGSTGSGRDRMLNEQGGLYTLITRGLLDGREHQERRIVAAISRSIDASRDWAEVLACARAPELEVIFSNTTEVGITPDPADGPEHEPPRSFPGKLTRFLHERARTFRFSPAAGLVVIPCELITGNGDRLRELVLQLAARWQLEPAFRRWVEACVPFCNTLVDRIVTGPAGTEAEMSAAADLEYTDALVTTCEPYRLFAIEGDAALRSRLRFAEADAGIVVAPDITAHRTRKLRLLNGTHSALLPVALLCGCESVADAMAHPLVEPFARQLMFDELVPSVDAVGAREFAIAVHARLGNPFLRHAWADIALHATMKMRIRVVPSIEQYTRHRQHAPPSLAFAFAAHLLLARRGNHPAPNGFSVALPQDAEAARIAQAWDRLDGCSAEAIAELVQAVCADTALWGTDLTGLPGFVEAVSMHLVGLEHEGAPRSLRAHLATLGVPGIAWSAA